MYELIQVSDKCYYIDCPAKIGIIKTNDSDVYLIDSGNNKDAGKKVLKILNSNGWQLKAILNTHSHADHIGGNKYLQEQTGCKIYAPTVEACFTNHPFLESALLYGAMPPKDLQSKFLLADNSCCDILKQELLPDEIEIIPLPGHCLNMVGFKCNDVVFLADCFSSRETLEKYQIGYIYDIDKYLKTLEYVKTIPAKVFVPSHAAQCDDICAIADYNAQKVLEISNKICKLCQEPLHFEALLQRLFSEYNLQMNFTQYALVGSTVRSYLTYLESSGKIKPQFDNNMLFWKTI